MFENYTMKVDLHRLHKAEYVTPRRPVLIEVKPAQYLSIQGKGSPDGEAFQESVQVLYSVAFMLKMTKKAQGQDYAVPKLEGLWWTDDDSDSFLEQPPETWQWQLLLRAPEFVAAGDVEKSAVQVARKKNTESARKVLLHLLEEGTCVQMLHVGPYASETDTLVQMWAFCGEKGFRLHGQHHEIYLSDSRRVAPEKLRTLLRHPVLTGTGIGEPDQNG